MATLTRVAENTKKYFIIGVAVLVLSLVAKIFISIFGFAFYLVGINAPAKPGNEFGVLLPIQVNGVIAYNPAKSSFLNYIPSGKLPTFPLVCDVYAFNSSSVNLLSDKQAVGVANYFGFGGKVNTSAQNIYEWDSTNKKLIYNVQTNQFRISVNNVNTQVTSDNASNNNTPLTQQGVVTAGSNILQSIPLSLSKEYDLANPELVFLNYTDKGITVVTDPTQANAVHLVYRRKYYGFYYSGRYLSTDKISTYTDNPSDGTLSMTIDSINADPKNYIVELNFNDIPVNNDVKNAGTYALKTADEAWQDVQAGQGYLISLVKVGSSPYLPVAYAQVAKFELQDVSLGYFDGVSPQKYLQPIYVLKGSAILDDGSSANFVFYDPAIN